MLELLQKHIRQRDMMDISEQLVRILSPGYTTRRQFKTLLNYMLQAGNAADPVAFLRKLAQKTSLKGRQEGRNEGRNEGQLAATKRIARAMLEEGLEPDQVAKLTGLSLRQLAKLQY